MKDTEQQIYNMLTENTGKHFLDSGSVYGRHWEKNQEKTLQDYKDLPKLITEVYTDDVSFILPVFHYLTAYLTTNRNTEKLNKKLNNFMKQSENSYLADIEDFGREQGFSTQTINTYNTENILSQTLQYTIYSQEKDWIYSTGDVYIALQIHNGCDVRGGYTKPYLFTFNEYVMEYFLSAMHQVYAAVTVNNETINGFNELGGYKDYWEGINPDKFIYLPDQNEVHYPPGKKIKFNPVFA